VREKGYDAKNLDTLLNKQSGLLGISGVSGDLRSIHHAIQEGNKQAQLALDIFIYRLRYFIGAMITTLGGIDVLSFTGGIGENDALVRARTCEGLGYLNLTLDQQQNSASPKDQEISTPTSAVRVLIIHTQEDWVIASDCSQLMQP
jgi:acetate kinase